MKKLTIGALALVGLAATSTVASAQWCVVPLIISAAIVSATENRELTSTEAMFCGLVREKVPPKATAPKKKVVVVKKKPAS